MCSYCNRGDYNHDPSNGIVYDEENKVYIQNIETTQWDDYYDYYIIESIGVNFCPMCGRKLKREEEDI